MMGTCQWLTHGSTDLCGKSCRGEYCKIHLARLRKGPGTKPCKECGIGVSNKYQLCKRCGYRLKSNRERLRAVRSFYKEIARLSVIDIYD